jgi:hypothetical protein
MNIAKSLDVVSPPEGHVIGDSARSPRRPRPIVTICESPANPAAMARRDESTIDDDSSSVPRQRQTFTLLNLSMLWPRNDGRLSDGLAD